MASGKIVDSPEQKLRDLSKTAPEIKELNLAIPPGASQDGAQGAILRMRALPPDIQAFVNLEALDLSGNELSSLPPEIGKLTKLKRLTLKGNKLARLPQEILELQSLEELDLTQNPIKELPEEIAKLGALKKLVIAKTDIKKLPDSFARMKNLEELDAYAADLTELPVDMSGLVGLKVLDLSGTELKTKALERIRAFPSSLTTLRLSHLDLKYLEEPVFQLKQLKRLEVAFTWMFSDILRDIKKRIPGLEVISGEFDFLFNHEQIKHPERVSKLYLTRLDLNKLPEELKQFVNLKEILLPENKFKEIPPVLFEMESLTSIELSENQISAVPKDILRLKNLEGIGLENNRLTEFPMFLLDLPKFDVMAVAGNRIKALPSDYKRLGKLSVLTIAGNPLTAQEYAILKRDLPKKLTISWSMNSEEFERPVFTLAEGLKTPDRVQVLDLSGLNIRELPKDVLKFKNLEVLNLSRNPIATLPIDLAKLRRLTFIEATDTSIGEPEVKALTSKNPKLKILIGVGGGG